MAAASVALPQQQPGFMSSRRIPLANNPNAANSPYRASATLKRPRATASEARDYENAQSPPKKKQLQDANHGTRRPQQISVDEREGRVFLDRGETAQPNAFSRRLAAIRDGKQSQNKVAHKGEKASAADLETLKQWKRHYRRVFPTFVFYFESLPHDVCVKASRQLSQLGAREEKFFSKAVTHIVTTRSVPPTTLDNGVPEGQASTAKAAIGTQPTSVQRTINPSLLERSADLQQLTLSRSGRQALEAASQRRRETLVQDAEVRRQQTSNADVLSKGRELGMKIWALEKFQRMMETMFEYDTDDLSEGQVVRKPAMVATTDTKPQPDQLSELLRNEKNMVADRPPWSGIVPFTGTYIYVHDVNERTKPVIIREYPKVARKEDGEWPQFRTVPLPRCPFLEDERESKKEKNADKKTALDEVRRMEQLPRTRAASAALEAPSVRTDVLRSQKPGLRESDSTANRMAKPPLPPSRGFEPPPPPKICASNNLDSMPAPQFASTRLQFSGLLKPGREPMASGVQQASVTSAIRSQMISSTAAAPTGKAGTSKEMHQLQRRAVERRTSLAGTNAGAAYMNNVRAAINHERDTAPRRTTRQNMSRTLGRIHEDMTISDDEDEQSDAVRDRRHKEVAKKDPKPGYCENCRDRYDDFNEHVESRKHKKFALAVENWTELDTLLKRLVRR